MNKEEKEVKAGDPHGRQGQWSAVYGNERPRSETPAGDAVFEGDCDAGVAALAALMMIGAAESPRVCGLGRRRSQCGGGGTRRMTFLWV